MVLLPIYHYNYPEARKDALDLPTPSPSLKSLQTEIEFFAFTKTARVITTTNSAVSALLSLLVLVIILRSQSKLRSVYHRIAFVMSFWDMTAACARTLSTLPMPTDIGNVYPFEGSRGNIGTCETQAILILTGMSFSLLNLSILSFFYLFTIRYRRSEKYFKRRILPGLWTLATISVICVILVFKRREMLNPRPMFPYCFVGPLPANCGDGVECIRGAASSEKILKLRLQISLGFVIVIMVVSMALVVIAVFKFEKEAIEHNFDSDRGADTNQGEGLSTVNEGENDSHRHDQSRTSETSESVQFELTKNVSGQAIMYTGAFLLTWLWLLIAVSTYRRVPPSNGIYWNIICFLVTFFLPLQGFFNALIFLYHKVHILRKSQRRLDGYEETDENGMSFCTALRTVVFEPYTVPEMLLSSIETVDLDNAIAELSQQHDRMMGGFDIGSHRESDGGVAIKSDVQEDRKISPLRPSSQANSVECELPADDGKSNTQRVSRYYHPVPTSNPSFVAEKVNPQNVSSASSDSRRLSSLNAFSELSSYSPSGINNIPSSPQTSSFRGSSSVVSSLQNRSSQEVLNTANDEIDGS